MKQVFLSYHDIHTDCIKLAKLIKKKYKPKKLILISRGGLIPGSIIANYLGIQDIDVIALKTYSDRKKNTDIKIFKRIKSEKKLVVIDEDLRINEEFHFQLLSPYFLLPKLSLVVRVLCYKVTFLPYRP